jgi:hypothetical protein
MPGLPPKTAVIRQIIKAAYKSDDWRYSGDDGKGHGFGNQSQGYGQTREKIVFGLDTVTKLSIN